MLVSWQPTANGHIPLTLAKLKLARATGAAEILGRAKKRNRHMHGRLVRMNLGAPRGEGT